MVRPTKRRFSPVPDARDTLDLDLQEVEFADRELDEDDLEELEEDDLEEVEEDVEACGHALNASKPLRLRLGCRSVFNTYIKRKE